MTDNEPDKLSKEFVQNVRKQFCALLDTQLPNLPRDDLFCMIIDVATRYLGFTGADLAATCHTTPAAFSRWRNGRNAAYAYGQREIVKRLRDFTQKAVDDDA
jgi:hypothetical protein